MAIENKEQLKQSFKAGLIDLYRDCFSAPPYNEYYEDEDVEKIFEEYLDTGSSILILFSHNAETIGFSVKKPLGSCVGVMNIVERHISSINKAMFGADLGIRSDYRGQRLSFFWRMLKKNGFTENFPKR